MALLRWPTAASALDVAHAAGQNFRIQKLVPSMPSGKQHPAVAFDNRRFTGADEIFDSMDRRLLTNTADAEVPAIWRQAIKDSGAPAAVGPPGGDYANIFVAGLWARRAHPYSDMSAFWRAYRRIRACREGTLPRSGRRDKAEAPDSMKSRT